MVAVNVWRSNVGQQVTARRPSRLILGNKVGVVGLYFGRDMVAGRVGVLVFGLWILLPHGLGQCHLEGGFRSQRRLGFDTTDRTLGASNTTLRTRRGWLGLWGEDRPFFPLFLVRTHLSP